MKHSVICIFNENKEEYNVKTSENDVKYSNFNMGEMDKSRELYSKEGDNSSRFQEKTVMWEHTIGIFPSPSCIYVWNMKAVRWKLYRVRTKVLTDRRTKVIPIGHPTNYHRWKPNSTKTDLCIELSLFSGIGFSSMVISRVPYRNHLCSSVRQHFSLKADMKSYIPLETAAIFFLANLFPKQGISSEYVTVDFIYMS